ncbi:MAG: DNA translocase FtsK 4TM domain-containing protein [Planctomycetota bacterium]|nr:DNA translocase FtsK 4TM domain-containing protein [Planctomycetota bacterium]
MARSTTAASARPSRARAARRAEAAEPVGTELLGVGLALGSVLFAAALATLAPAGTTGGVVNVTGGIGRAVAQAFAAALGLGAWILPAFGVSWGIQCIRGRRPAAWLRKALLLPLLMTLTSIAAALVLEGGFLGGLARVGPGGYLGISMGSVAFSAFGKASGLVIMVVWLLVFRWMTEIDLVKSGMALATAVMAKRRGDAAPARRRATSLPREEDVGGVATAEDEDDEEYEDDEDEYEDDEEEDDEEEADEDDDGEDDDDELEAADEKPAAPATPTAAPRRPPVAMEPIPRPKRKPLRPRGEYQAPPLTLLTPGERVDPATVRAEVEANAEVLEETLASFGVEARVVSHQRGPVITFFEIKVPSGVRLSRVTALADDIAISLKAPSIRIVAPIPGRSTVGIEVPNETREVVRLRDVLETESDKIDRAAIPVAIGTDTAGRPIVEDLATTPHLLIAGATGSGKSVGINALLLSILYTRGPEEVSLILVDPKQVELSFYEGIPHLLTPVVTDMRKAAKILEWAVDRMEERYAKLLATGVRNIAGYNNLPKERILAAREKHGYDDEELPDHMAYIVIVIDELADVILTNGKDVELAITRLAQKSRAVGIHLVLATQRPSTNVITGLIKANMPTRISFVVSSKVDSRVVLDANGADKLLGNGDMLYMHPRSLHLRRAQGALVTDQEARATVEFLEKRYPDIEYEDLLKVRTGELGDPMQEDDLYEDGVRAVLSTRLGSASMLQRRLGVGYTRASRLVDMMADRGLVGPHVGSKAREVLMELEEWEAMRATQSVPGAAGRASEAFDRDDPPPVDTSWD